METTKSFADNDLKIPHLSWAILLVSVLGLFLETLFIRWIGTEIRIFAYLQNTILVACFLGLGIGLFTSSKPIQIKQSLLPMVALLLLMTIPVTRAAMGNISQMLSTLQDFVIWSHGDIADRTARLLAVLFGLGLTFSVLVLIVDIFVPIGRLLGRLMNESPSAIEAYSVNIVGSIFGTWLFVLVSYLYLQPYIWFLLLGLLFAVFIFWSTKERMINLSLLSIVVVLAWFSSQIGQAIEVIWSPYQKLVVNYSQPGELGKYQITVNNATYQEIMDLSEAYISANPQDFPEELLGLSQYDIPLLLHPNAESFLVVGSGTGNDVAGALRHDVSFITAVEIDPAIIAIGRELHPEHPYSSPRVHVVNDDARSFFATTAEKYDIISFGLLDSHTTTSMTNARLDHYVYTKESISQVKSRLQDGGIVVLNFFVQRPFIADRIERVLEEVFGQPPLVFVVEPNQYGRGGVIFVSGDLNTIRHQLTQNSRLASYIEASQEARPLSLTNTTRIITDDWPYLYLETSRIPNLYYLLIVLMILLFVRSNKKWQSYIRISNLDRSFWHFFFLGAAFLLLEVQNISKASVVLGNTWQVNTIIISSILAMALLANWISYKFPSLPLAPVYFLLVATCVALYFLDLARFGFLPYFTKAILVGSLTSLPMLFSGIIFIRSFTIIKDKSSALGANLIGALVGALLQSITFVIGIKALLLVVAGLYLLSLFTSPSLGVSVRQGAIQEFAK